MMLWDIIRDFYVQYIFGGYDSFGNSYASHLGNVICYDNGVYDDDIVLSSTERIWTIATDPTGYSYVISSGDWLSTTFTIITLILFVFFLYVFLRWLFKVVSGLILLRN